MFRDCCIPRLRVAFPHVGYKAGEGSNLRYRGPLTILIAAALAGCQLSPPAATKTPRKTPSSKTSAAAGGVAKGSAIKVDYAPLIEARRPIDAADLTAKTKLVTVELTGKAKLLSDHGGGIVSNNSGGLISDHGSGLIANNGGGLIANNGGGLTAKTKYALLGGEPAAESLLAEAQIEVLDGSGQVLVGSDGRPLGARTDATGAFKFSGQLPDENLVLRIRLYNGGQLLALLPRATAGGPREVDLDTAASLGAAYVLETFVQKRPAVFAKLPAAEAAALRGEIEAARAFLPTGARSYRLADLVAATGALSEQAKPVAERLEKIKALLLAGQANLGDGRPAREVSLSTPAGIVGLADGTMVIAENSGSRLRRITPDLRAGLFLGLGVFFDGKSVVESQGEFIETPGAMVALPDGGLLVADTLANRVRKVATDGRVTTLLGTGTRTQGLLGGLGTQTNIAGTRGLALGPDGSIYVGEVPKTDDNGRIIRLRPDGMTEEVMPPTVQWERAEVAALAVAGDGTLWVADSRLRGIHRRSPDGTWALVDGASGTGDFSDIQLTPEGELVATGNDSHQIWRYGRDGTRTLLAGTGVEGYGGDGGPATAAVLNRPAGLWIAPDGRIVFVDAGNSVVREIRRDGTIHTIAGAAASDQVGDATAIAINSPAGIALDGDGRLVIAEAAGDTIKRLEGGRLVRLAGAGKGLEGDGGPALSAKFNTLAGFGFSGQELYVIDSINERIRKIDASGIVTTVAGAVNGRVPAAVRQPALSTVMGRPLALAIGPDGKPYWTDNEEHQVRRLTKDGFVETIAGLVTNDSGDAPDAPGPAVGPESGLSSPVGLAFDAAGDLYVCDSGNLKIRKITGLQTGAPIMSTWAGTGFSGALAMIGGQKPDDEGKPKQEAVLIGPLVMTFGEDGACYVAEAGTLRLATLGAMTGMDMSGLPRITARIRRIAKDGTVRTIAGPGTSLLADPTSDDTLITPLGLVVDREGRLIVADSGTNQVKLIPKGAF